MTQFFAPLRHFLIRGYPFFALMILVSCSSNLTTPGEALRLIADPLDPAFVNETYSANVRVVGGLPPYRFEVSAGALPPGLNLQGGTLRGTPGTTGDYRFTITVSELTLNVPNTDIQRPVTLRAEIRNGRELEAFRTLITWDAELFRIAEGSLQRASRNYAIFYEASEGALQVDVAMLGGRLSGERRVFEFTLEPLAVTTLGVNVETEFIGTNNRHDFVSAFEGQRSSLSTDAPFPDDAFEPPEPDVIDESPLEDPDPFDDTFPDDTPPDQENP
jgi:hypothetical protein